MTNSVWNENEVQQLHLLLSYLKDFEGLLYGCTEIIVTPTDLVQLLGYFELCKFHNCKETISALFSSNSSLAGVAVKSSTVIQVENNTKSVTQYSSKCVMVPATFAVFVLFCFVLELASWNWEHLANIATAQRAMFSLHHRFLCFWVCLLWR